MEIAEPDDCASCGRGAAVCVRGEDVCNDLESPGTVVDEFGRDAFANPLRRDIDGCLWVDVRRIFDQVAPQTIVVASTGGTMPSTGGHTFSSVPLTYTNTSSVDQVVDLEVEIKSGLIANPPAAVLSARIEYVIALSTGDVAKVFASQGGWSRYSGSFSLATMHVAPGISETVTADAGLDYLLPAGGPFTAEQGEIRYRFLPRPDLEA